MEQAENVSIEELELVLLGSSGAALADYVALCREQYILAVRNKDSNEYDDNGGGYGDDGA